ncbi:GNAT family N-acetyltransferase [Lentilitoribacter sp. EG35]|uniref:GNAT family N-acetyltransferase n=1 Tax=Lentilitoribacter sp. EG35 TaxID=3234192 RepID=UPI00345FC78D
MTKFTIRRATLKDTQPLTSCIDAAYAGFLAKGIELPPVSEGIADDITNNIVWVAEKNEWIIGGLILVVNSDHAQSHAAKLANIAVHPSAGGLGIGRALITTCGRYVRDLGLSELHLATHKDMPENVGLYEHLGWHVTGAEGNKIFMTKALI